MKVLVARHPNVFDLQRDGHAVVETADGQTAGELASSLGEYSGLFVNRARVEHDYELEDGDWVDLVERPEGLELGTAIAFALISAAINVIFALLIGPPKPPKERDDEQSSVHGFSGIAGDRVEGLPIPIGIGEFRVGGQVISEFVQVVGLPPVVDYYFLLFLADGEGESIGGVSTDTPAGSPLESGNPASPSRLACR